MVKLPRLRAYRERKALTQRELAEAAGLTRPNIARLEAGRQAAIPGTVRKLALALGVEPADLMDDPPLTRSLQQVSGVPEHGNRRALDAAS